MNYAFKGNLTNKWRDTHYDEIVSSTPKLERVISDASKGSTDINIDSELPKFWQWVFLFQIGELNRGKSKHRPRDDKRLFGGVYPFIQTGDIRHANGGIISRYSETYNEFGLKQSKLWPKNTLCITIAANIADTAILDIEACFPDSVVGFIANAEIADGKFVHYYFKTIKKKLETNASATAQKNINLSTLREIIVPLPPTREQRKIVEEIDRLFSVAGKCATIVDQSIHDIEILRYSILENAFEGKLVQQNPDDEPAQSLLERISQEKPSVNNRNRNVNRYDTEQMRLI